MAKQRGGGGSGILVKVQIELDELWKYHGETSYYVEFNICQFKKLKFLHFPLINLSFVTGALSQ
jgi:hypothetical protein